MTPCHSKSVLDKIVPRLQAFSYTHNRMILKVVVSLAPACQSPSLTSIASLGQGYHCNHVSALTFSKSATYMASCPKTSFANCYPFTLGIEIQVSR